MSISLDEINETDLLNTYPHSVMRSIEALEAQRVPWDAIGTLLAASPTSGIALKGGGQWSGALWTGVKHEIRSFLCTDSASYSDLRSEWDGLSKKSSALAVAALSGAIGAQLGVAGGVIAPLVIWLLVVTLRIGKNSICQVLNQTPITTNSPPV